MALFYRPHPCLTPPSDMLRLRISTFSALVGYNSVAEQYGSIFILLTAVASQIREIQRNSERIGTYRPSSSRSLSSISVSIDCIAYATSY